MRFNVPTDDEVMTAYREFNAKGTGWLEAHVAIQRQEDFKEWLSRLKNEITTQAYLEGRARGLSRITEEKELARAEGSLAAANEICLKLEEKISQTPIADLRANGIQSGFVIALRIASGVAQENLDKIPESQL